MAIIGTVPFRLTAKNQQLYKGSLKICAWTGKLKIFPSKVSLRVTFKIIWQKQAKDGDNWSSTSMFFVDVDMFYKSAHHFL
jgi:hypothetical protein